MKYWSMVLHFYQPPTQELKITKSVLESCYLPLLRILSEKSGFGLTLNISGSLILQLKRLGVDEFFDLIKKLISSGKVEIVNSVMYHPLMPITPKDILIRQIEKNSLTLKNLFGVESTAGFFPPELAVDKDTLDLIHNSVSFPQQRESINYVFVDENAPESSSKISTSIVKYDRKYLLINNRQIGGLFRSYPKQLSVEIVLNLIQKNSGEEDLIVTANDAELFGHHYSERLQVLADLLDAKEIKFITASEAVVKFGNQVKTISDVKASSWQNCQGFDLWNKNGLQQEYLQLLKMVHDLTLGSLDGAAEDLFDQANSSCYLYWLSNWPWWHPDLVGTGARNLIKCVRMANIDNQKKAKAEEAYHLFLNKMWQYHWSGNVETKYKEWQSQI
ncbi:hypothetical protein HYU89_04165 [Candidatus Collierbacteria bacterium]|nr:hypothetical protein [Candidatus Collierbacteria bacterium]